MMNADRETFLSQKKLEPPTLVSLPSLPENEEEEKKN